MQATKGARKATQHVVGGNRDLTRMKRQTHRRNRRAVRQAIQAGKDTTNVEKQVTAWDVS